MHSISAVLAQALIDAVRPSETGLSDLAASFTPQAFSSPSAAGHIPLHELNQFFAHVQQQSGNEDIGLLAYQRAHPGNLGMLGYAIMSSPTIHDALKCIIDYYPTVGAGFCIYLDEQPTCFRMVGISASSQNLLLPRVFLDAILSITLGLLHWLTPNARVMPILTEFTYSQPQDTTQLERLFGPNLSFSAAVNALTFRRTDGDLPLATFDASLQHVHHDYLKRQTRELTADKAVTRVQRIILQHLNQAKPLAMEHIALSMNLSQHQLTRALEAEGQSFQKLVDLARRQHSHHLLVNTQITLKQVSYSAGFKSQSALNKACARWFGMSPGHYRHSRQSGAAPARD